MNFGLTEERQMLQDTLRRFLRERYDVSLRNEIVNSDAGMSADIWAQLAELGVLGALFTEEQGGFGGKGFDLTTVFEELGRAGVIEPLLSALLSGSILAGMGRDELVAEIITGEQIIDCEEEEERKTTTLESNLQQQQQQPSTEPVLVPSRS